MWPPPRAPTAAERAGLAASGFPALSTAKFEVSGQATFPAIMVGGVVRALQTYNCVGWALDQEYPFNYWPPDDIRFISRPPMDVMDDYFVGARKMTKRASIPAGIAKAIALYSKPTDIPTHVALLRSDGRWESKLGQNVRIIHENLADLDGPAYGAVTGYYI